MGAGERVTFSSPRKRIIEAPSYLIETQFPLSSFDVRDVVFNNLLHHADQSCARVLVNFTPALVTGKNVYIEGVDADGRWSVVESFGPFPLSVMQRDGALRAYPLRVAIHACGGDGTAHTFAVQTSVEPWTRPVDVSLVTDGGDTCTFAATTSTASVQLTPDVDDLITPQSVLFAPSAVETLTEEGGDATTVLCYMAHVRVMAIGTSPRLYGLHVAEVYQ